MLVVLICCRFELISFNCFNGNIIVIVIVIIEIKKKKE
jgi:hypothetical protein